MPALPVEESSMIGKTILHHRIVKKIGQEVMGEARGAKGPNLNWLGDSTRKE